MDLRGIGAHHEPPSEWRVMWESMSTGRSVHYSATPRMNFACEGRGGLTLRAGASIMTNSEKDEFHIIKAVSFKTLKFQEVD
jgi:hypothetical protein